MECDHCKLVVKSKYNLKSHLENNKSCLKLRGLDTICKFICKDCNGSFVSNMNLKVHLEICKNHITRTHEQDKNKKIEELTLEKDKVITDLQSEIKKIKESKEKDIKDLYTSFEKEREAHEKTVKDLQTQVDKMFYTIERLASHAIDKPTTTTTINTSFEKETIPISLKDQMSAIEIEIEDTVNYSMITLNNVTITSRPIDHYVNATELCQAGGKKFSHWFSLDTTKELIKELSADAGITASGLVDTNKGGNTKTEQRSWIHPDLSISLAQWISPKFAIQVSKWVRTLFNKGSVEIDLNLVRQKDERIKKLENVCLSKQRRVEYPEKNVIYLLTTDDHLKRRTYILGKAKNLTNRLGTYNKTCDHTVVYYKECKNEEDMDTAEIIVLSKLRDYKEQANRDRFILPEDKDISFFIQMIDGCIHFLK